jgi:hypothetical protein
VKPYKFKLALMIDLEAESNEDAGKIADAIQASILDGLSEVAPSTTQASVSDSTLSTADGHMVLRPDSVCAELLAGGTVCGQPATEIVGSDGLGYYPACPQHAETWSDRSHGSPTEAPE